MLKFTVLAILLAAVCAVPIENEKPQESVARTTVVENLEEYLLAHPEVRILGELERDVSVANNEIKYILGKRQEGDRNVGSSKANNEWPAPQDVSSRVAYPTSGTGATVTQVEIDVVQSDNWGRAVVVGGGVGQRSIDILVEARQTLIFRLDAKIYGR